MSAIIARKAAAVLMAAALLTTLFIVGNIENRKLKEAGIK